MQDRGRRSEQKVKKSHQQDHYAIIARRFGNGGDYWATSDGRWGVGAPYSTYECGLMLGELGLGRSSPVSRGIATVLFGAWEEDGRIRPGPRLPVQPCHTANAARLLCRLGYERDARMSQTFRWLLDNQHADGGWRCSRVRLGVSAETDASNPGVTLAVLDSFRFVEPNLIELDRAVDTLLHHWSTRRPLGPCAFGIGSRFMQVEFPFVRYNLFSYVYVLSFYRRARGSRSFRAALQALESKLVEGSVVVEHLRPELNELAFCRQGAPSAIATRRYEEIIQNVTLGEGIKSLPV
jgi:hypothetical protein